MRNHHCSLIQFCSWCRNSSWRCPDCAQLCPWGRCELTLFLMVFDFATPDFGKRKSAQVDTKWLFAGLGPLRNILSSSYCCCYCCCCSAAVLPKYSNKLRAMMQTQELQYKTMSWLILMILVRSHVTAQPSVLSLSCNVLNSMCCDMRWRASKRNTT